LPRNYKWTALSNTTLGMFMAALDASIVLIALPAIFRGINLDPLTPSNIGYLLWMLMGYLVVTAVLVVTFGRLGDMFGRVRMYNAGFAVFTFASIALSLTPGTGESAALWLIAWRVVQGIGGALLMANSTAILTDAFPASERGRAMGISMIAGISGSFIGLIAGGLLADIDWRLVFWVNVPFGIFGTVWAYAKLRELGQQRRTSIDWWGNATFAVGLIMILIGITYGLQPANGHNMGWTSGWVLFELLGGAALLIVFAFIESRVPEPMFHLELFRIRAFTAGNVASLLSSIGRGGLQFMLIIWLQGSRLPRRRACRRLVVGSVRRASVLGRRHAPRGRVLLLLDAVAGQLLVPGVRAVVVDERHRHGSLRSTERDGDHELGAGGSAGRGVGDASDVPEHRDGPVDRSVLQPHDRGALELAAHDAAQRTREQRGSARDRGADRQRAASRKPVRLVPGVQPDGEARRPADAVAASASECGDHHRQAVLPRADLAALHRRSADRVQCLDVHVPDRGVGVVAPRRTLRCGRRGGRSVRCAGGGLGGGHRWNAVAGGVGSRMTEPRYRIGEIAEDLGVSTRTLRYYEELGLLTPSAYSKGGSRRYVEADRQRILRIRELQAIMGFNLEEIREILHADDRLSELSTEYRKGVSPKRQRAIVLEAARLNARTQEQVIAKMAILQAFQDELEAKAARYKEVGEELGIDVAAELRAATEAETR
jgi:MFS family permease/DNA-binding transcriptional MerR regulator